MFQPEMIRSKNVWVDGDRIHFLSFCGHEARTQGVVLLHGGGADCASLSWKPFLEKWPGRRVAILAPDLPGHGLSAKPPEGYSTGSAVTFLVSFLEALGLRTVKLVGLSLGGLIALGFERRYPERVRRLVLVNSLGLGPHVPFLPAALLLARWTPGETRLRRLVSWYPSLLRLAMRFVVRRREALTPELLAEIGRELERPGSGLAWRRFLRSELTRKGLRTHLGDRLEAVKAPTLIVHGRQDRLIPVRLAVQAHRRIPHSRLHLFDDCGHWPPREVPEAFGSVVLPFLLED